MKTVPTTILDACCGGRMFYFEKNHPNVLYIDRRFETVEMKDRDKIRTLEISPDLVMDFTDMKFPDECFNFVVFDPPHLINCGKNSWLAKKYGKLDKDTWRETLSKGLSECLRVVKPGCVVAMKRKKGGVTLANQKQWIKTLNEAGIQTVVCKGCDAAIEFIESITKP
nr:MAG TPA: Methyltransferase domain [Caudoviricetes sp.]